MLFTGSYQNRIADDQVSSALSNYSAVCIYGPLGCGASSTASFHASQKDVSCFIDNCERFPSLYQSMLDEASRTWNNGVFMAASSYLPDVSVSNSRVSYVRMGTMSLYETGDSCGFISLASLFEKEVPKIHCGSSELGDILSLCNRGGWPSNQGQDYVSARQYSNRYVNKIADFLDDTKKRGKVEKILGLINAFAFFDSSVSSVSEYLKYLDNSGSGLSLSRNTVLAYISQFEKLMFISEQPAFIPKSTISRIILKTPKYRLADPSLVAALLHLDINNVRQHSELFSIVFDNLCVHDLRIYARALGADVLHYRDNYGISADSVVQLPDGRWGAFKHLISLEKEDEAANELLRLNSAFNGTPSKPSCLGIISGLSEYAYTRPDGVMVIPITALKP